jgi:hypothetical protein
LNFGGFDEVKRHDGDKEEEEDCEAEKPKKRNSLIFGHALLID